MNTRTFFLRWDVETLFEQLSKDTRLPHPIHTNGTDQTIHIGTLGTLRMTRADDTWPSALLGIQTPYETQLTPLHPNDEPALDAIFQKYKEHPPCALIGAKGEIHDYREALRCPRCGLRTHTQRACYDICHVCAWEDDGHDEDNPHEPSGPNGCTIADARRSFWKKIQSGQPNAPFTRHTAQPTRSDLLEAALHLLTQHTTQPGTRATLRACADRLCKTPHEYATLWAAALDEHSAQRTVLHILLHREITAPLLIQRAHRSGDDLLKDIASAAHIEIRDIHKERAKFVKIGDLLGMTRLRPPTHTDLEELADRKQWDTILALGKHDALSPTLCAPFRTALESLLSTPWTEWDAWWSASQTPHENFIAWTWGMHPEERLHVLENLHALRKACHDEEWREEIVQSIEKSLFSNVLDDTMD